MKTIKITSWSEVPKDYTGIIEWPNGTKFWCFNYKLHRVDGPAVEWVSGGKEYWINGKKVSKEAQEVLYAMYKLKGIKHED